MVGVVRDAPYRNVREATLPVAFVPFHSVDAKGALMPVQTGTFMGTHFPAANPMALASTLRRIVLCRRHGRISESATSVHNWSWSTGANRAWRLLAMLARMFFMR